MTPAARLSAAIAILDRFLGGEAAEKALTGWARGARYAGSGDRVAVRDLVFDALRCLRSHAALGGGMTGRGLVLGGLRARGEDEAALFTGEGHAPAPVTDRDMGAAPDGNAALDCPDWLADELRTSLGEAFEPVMRSLQNRAPVFLRVNLRRGSVEEASARLAVEGIATAPHRISPTALEVTDGARRVQASRAYAEGLVELQDASSQAVVDLVPLQDGMRVLDYCAGGGGKTLAMAGRTDAIFFAHDAVPGRMADLPARADRAGVAVRLTDDPTREGPFDLVLCDVPCSGSGAWRRSPEGKWRLDRPRLDALIATQQNILATARNLVRPGGHLAYVTCSLLEAENGRQIETFLSQNPGLALTIQRKFTPLDGGDGFYISVLTCPE